VVGLEWLFARKWRTLEALLRVPEAEQRYVTYVILGRDFVRIEAAVDPVC
jgi:hypothetical protein